MDFATKLVTWQPKCVTQCCKIVHFLVSLFPLSSAALCGLYSDLQTQSSHSGGVRFKENAVLVKDNISRTKVSFS